MRVRERATGSPNHTRLTVDLAIDAGDRLLVQMVKRLLKSLLRTYGIRALRAEWRAVDGEAETCSDAE